MNTNESTEKLCLKNVYELLGEKFYIPSYQRGYRWTDIQVQELLDDIWEFSQQSSSDKAAFYCLQPIVVVQREGYWELVDGQQRLTTLYIILHYLEKEHLRRDLKDAYKKPLYTLKYETRADSETFLKNIQHTDKSQNIDFFHISKAYEVIAEWFKEKDYNDNNALLATLLAKPSEAQSVKVIWYDLTDECIENDYAVDVFSRINIGKIPLTNAELVKALFLQRNHFNEDQVSLKQIQIASEWDAIERQLQEPDFWHFICNTDSTRVYDTRIEYIFDLMKQKKSNDEAYFTFHQFNNDFKQGNVDIDHLWKSIKNYFLTFDEWYRDRELFHLIGFLVDSGSSVANIKEYAERTETKTRFKAYLKKEIRKKVNCQLEDLSYGNPFIKRILLLFNIQTLLSTKEADIRFPFDRYKQENWDIEHIRSQADSIPTGISRYEWLKDIYEYLSQNRSLEEEIIKIFLPRVKALLESPKLNETEFEAVYVYIANYFNHSEINWINSLGNLALLDSTTNRSYKNAFFPIKRARIIRNDMLGIFVPICTKNVFLKFYSRSTSDLMFWRESDSKDYIEAIRSRLSEYLPEQGGIDD